MADVVKVSRFGGIGKGIVKLIKEIRTELKKVIWPTRSQLINNTATVLMACLVIGAIIWVFDIALTKVSEIVFAPK